MTHLSVECLGKVSNIISTQKPFTKYEGDLALTRLRLQTVFTLLKTLLGETEARETPVLSLDTSGYPRSQV